MLASRTYRLYLTRQTWLVALLVCGTLMPGLAQVTLERTVIGSTGESSTSASYNLEFTVGEPLVETSSSANYRLSQGFQQSNYVLASPVIIDFVNVVNETCIGAANGSLSIEVSGCPPPYTIQWSNGATTETITGLEAGTYTVQVTGSNGCQVENSFSLERNENVPCELVFYSGITPNNDGFNDEWIIDNIEFFPNNTVSIASRGGTIVWDAEDYDNEAVVFRGEGNNGNGLPNDTYFYIVEIDGNTFTGWLEITR